MVARYTTSFGVAWFREALRTYYIRDLQTRAFRNALNARVEYFDTEGSDDILNAIVTQTYYAGRVIQRSIKLIEHILLSTVYFLVALVIAPWLTIITGGRPRRVHALLQACSPVGVRRRQRGGERERDAPGGGSGRNSGDPRRPDLRARRGAVRGLLGGSGEVHGLTYHTPSERGRRSTTSTTSSWRSPCSF